MIQIFFQTETDRINQMIERGKAMTDLQYLEMEISRWLMSPQRLDMLTGERYYDGCHDILSRKRTAIGEDGQLIEVDNLPNNHVIDNQYAKAVDQKVNYLLGKPLTFDTENKQYEDALKKVFGKRFQQIIRQLGEDSLNCGIGWIYPYYSDGSLCFKRFNPWEILPFWTDAEHTMLDCAARIYEVETYEGPNHKTIQKVEFFTRQGIRRYILSSGHLVEDSDNPVENYITVGERAYNWDRVPLIPFKYNPQETPLIRRVKSLQDSINEMMSDMTNNMQEDTGNTILVVRNYDGQGLGEFRRNLATYKAVKVSDDGDVSTIKIEFNAQNYKEILNLLKKALIENARCYDAKDDRMSNNPNQMNIQSMYSDIDLDANGMETEYQAAFDNLLWFVNAHLANTGAGDFDGTDINIIFNRDVLINETESIENCQKSVGILSDETIVSQHPWTSDVKKELQRIKKERQDQDNEGDGYTDAFQEHRNGGEVNEEQ